MQRREKRIKDLLKKLIKSRITWISVFAIAAPIFVIGGFLIRYYFVFNAVIEEKLGKNYSFLETEIYAAPKVLLPGDETDLPELVTRLRRLGYTEAADGSAPEMSYYRAKDDDPLLIHNDESLAYEAGRTVEITFDSGAIRTIVDEGTREKLKEFTLKPELLSNIITKDREKRRFVAFRDLPKVLIDAVLAAEDRRFFSHNGIDPIRIIKALIVDIRAGDTVQGASTLTQQFVKNYFLTPERTWKRKLTDMYMSVLLEKRLSKEKILELYANEVYLGQRGSFGIVGFGEGAEAYFNKSVRNLNLEEAALLAGIITAPNRYTPLRYPDRAKSRRDLVLDQMAEYGMISSEDCRDAKERPLASNPSTVINYSDAPYFVDYVQDLLVAQYGDVALARSKYKVYTTLDMDLQQAAFEAVRDEITAIDDHFEEGKRAIPRGTVQASLIALDPRNGRVLAMIGGRNYGASQYNRITDSKRQPGSIFKPFVYAAALETAYSSPSPITAASTILDKPTQFEFEDLMYEPKNFKEEYLGQVTLRQAITRSLNIATIKFAGRVGYPKIAELARRLGLNELIKPYPAIAIGAFEVTPLEMARAYTAFANMGVLSELAPIQMVCDSENGPIFEAEGNSEQVLTPQISFMITSLMQSVMNQGTGAGVRSRGFQLPAAGKTGTSHDGWFAGYTPDLLCIVWVGFDDNTELNLSGAQSALPIWTSFMKRAAVLKPLSGEAFPVPEGIVQVEIDPTTGLLATEHCLERIKEFYIKGTEPVLPCYGNPYEKMFHSTPQSIYSTPPKEPTAGADNRITPP